MESYFGNDRRKEEREKHAINKNAIGNAITKKQKFTSYWKGGSANLYNLCDISGCKENWSTV